VGTHDRSHWARDAAEWPRMSCLYEVGYPRRAILAGHVPVPRAKVISVSHPLEATRGGVAGDTIGADEQRTASSTVERHCTGTANGGKTVAPGEIT
jgi:hypothetical protein